MTTLRAAAQQALEALEDMLSGYLTPYQAAKTSAALEAALAEPVQDHFPDVTKMVQEPVAWGVFGANLHDMFFTEEEAHELARLKGDGSTVAPLYTSPPQRKPLLASDIVTMYDENPRSDSEMIAFARAIEAKHGIGSKT
jgi:hypothetical protein